MIRLLKQRWIQFLLVGLSLFVLTDITLRFTDNINYLTTVMMLGAFLVPISFVAYFYQQETLFNREPKAGSILPTMLLCALFGGLIGTLAAGTLEYTTISSPALINLAWVGPIEEFAKLIVPVALYIIMRNRFRSELDGLLFGVAAGMAFAALETMGYELVSLVSSQGNINALDETILLRGLLSPAGHASWTGLITATLWRERARTGKPITLTVVGFFLLVAALHSAWDLVSGSTTLLVLIPSYVVISGISLTLLVWRFREARRQQPVLAVV
jgi:protease PrsW